MSWKPLLDGVVGDRARAVVAAIHTDLAPLTAAEPGISLFVGWPDGPEPDRSGTARALGATWKDGAFATLLRAVRMPTDEASLAAARDCADQEGGAPDASLGRGAAGFAHLYSRLYQATGEQVFLDMAGSWLARVLAYQRPGRAFGGYEVPGLLDGAAGIGLVLHAAITDVAPDWDGL